MIPVSYSLRNIRQRAHVTLATSFGVALVVFVLVGSAMLNAGLKRLLDVGTVKEDALILATGAASEADSAFPDFKAKALAALPQVATDGQGPIVSPELLISITRPRMSDGVPINALVRGVGPRAALFHPHLASVSGRMPSPTAEEAAVGKSLLGRFRGLQVGDTLDLGKHGHFKIVGVFSDGGGSAESEIWIPLASAQSAFNYEGAVSSVNVRLKSASDFPAFQDNVAHDKQVGLKAYTRDEFNRRQAETLSVMIGILGIVISGFFGVSAVLGASTAIFASVENRTREFGTLRVLGFSKGSILVAVILESLLLTLIGGAVGVLASLALRGREFSFLGPNWGQIVFRFELTPVMLVYALVASLVAGLCGGLFPALRASRVPPTAALRG